MRFIEAPIEKDLRKKMVFLSGPRQCGKTTLGKALLRKLGGAYFNWDDADDQKALLKKGWPDDTRLLVLDEIHKYPRWKNWVKGLYDKSSERHSFLVTGSARLDVYRRGGDSLLGRYHHWRLHPFCLAEKPEGISASSAFARLMSVGGFPEPFLANDPVEAKRWRRERKERVIREDLRDLEKVRELTLVSLLADLLRERVGGGIVVSNLAGDLQVAPKTVAHWLELLERMYLVFAVRPYVRALPRAIQKAPKVYFYDNGDVATEAEGGLAGARFENLVATHLLKRCHFLEDSTGDSYELQYLRDKEGHEVDFVVVRNRKPICLVEAKWADSRPSPSLAYFGSRLGIESRVQVCGELKAPGRFQGVSVVRAVDWLSAPLDKGIFGGA